MTPNFEEAKKIFNTNEPINFLSSAKLNNNILLKGGHNNDENFSTDILFTPKNKTEFKTERLQNAEKHGSGCVLSSAIAANLALNKNIEEACDLSKNYVQQFLSSTKNKLGFHH
jgi:hydroxymethylpyrimidine/phosphomethylpyrimidine kinase